MRRVPIRRGVKDVGLRSDMDVAVIGAGPGGIVAGKRMIEEGFTSFVVFEASDGVGGTWNLNRYPGCECDVQSVMYSFSFEFKVDWSKPYGRQAEILEYMRMVADKYGVTEHCRFGDAVVDLRWDDAADEWVITTASGARSTARAVIAAVGMLTEPVVPEIPGLADFTGPAFHSARWDDTVDLRDRRVAIIGSAASAVQIVPVILGEVERLHLFQRTANWVLPKIDRPYTAEELDAFRADPTPLREMRQLIEDAMNRGMTFALTELNAERERTGLEAIEVVADPELRRKLTPDHPFGCKRPLLSNDFYPSFNDPRLELVTDPIDRITATGIRTVDGVEREIDVLVLATGYAATKFVSTIDVTGRDGLSIHEAWRNGARAYMGATTTGFPNLFMLYGPNMNNGSIIQMIEYQVEHVLELLSRLADDDLSRIDVRPEAMDRFNVEVQRAIDGIDVWNIGCNTYYRSPDGRIVTQWPFSMLDYRDMSVPVDWEAFDCVPKEVAP